EVQPDIAASPRRYRPPRTDDVAALANCGFPAAANRRSAGEIRLRNGRYRGQSVRGPWLYPDVRRPYPAAGKTMVQHGDLRQSRQTGRTPRSAQDPGLTRQRITAGHNNK